jgi:hypothetical protein
VALEDVLYHPHLANRVKPNEHPILINFLRRHPAYATAFNTYVGYKLLRQQLVRGGGAGTNRKSNDVQRLHNEAANRLWGVLEQHPGIVQEFETAAAPLKMEWHRQYYKEVAHTLYSKLSDYGAGDMGESLTTMDEQRRRELRAAAAAELDKPADTAPRQTAAAAPALPSVDAGVAATTTRPFDILGAILEGRSAVAEGTSKRHRPMA